MTTLDLTGVHTRLSWAHRHIERFEACGREFIESDPYSIVPEIEPQTGDEVFRIKARHEPPPELALILGDAIHTMRSVLDHLAYGVASIPESGCKRPDQVVFPVCRLASGPDRRYFSTHETTTLRGVVRSGIEAIRDLQPYKRCNTDAEIDLDPMWILNALWNADKHRATNVVGAYHGKTRIRMTQVRVRLRPGDPPIPSPVIAKGAVYEGGEVARIPRALQDHAHLDISGTYGIALDPAGPAKGAPLSWFLHYAHGFVRDKVVPVFTQDFR